MSRETFDKCLSNQTIIDGLNEVKQRGRKFGVIGTPTFFINGRKAQGTVTYEEIKAMLAPHGIVIGSTASSAFPRRAHSISRASHS